MLNINLSASTNSDWIPQKWHVPMSPNTKLMKRNQSYLPLRSCLVQQPVKVYESPAVVDKKRTFVVLDNMPNGEPGATYYEQLQGPNCWIRIGWMILTYLIANVVVRRGFADC